MHLNIQSSGNPHQSIHRNILYAAFNMTNENSA